MSLILRRATPADAATIVEFNSRLALESEGKSLDPVMLFAGVTAILADDAKGFYTMAERDSVAVGQTMITREWSDWRNGWFWWIQSVYVREDSRGTGVFQSIFRRLQQEAQSENAIGLRLYFDRDNERAVKVYRKLGMHDTNYGLLEMYPL